MIVARQHKGAAPPGEDVPPGLRARELCATTVLISAAGEIDACNAESVAGQTEAGLAGYRQLVLDLSAVTFFGTAGYAMLRRVDDHCRRRHLDWVVVPGREAGRLLRICDPDGVIPTAENVVMAAAWLTRTEFHTA